MSQATTKPPAPRSPIYRRPGPQKPGPFVLSLVEDQPGHPKVLAGGLADLENAVQSALKYDVPQQTEWGITSAQGFLDFAQGMLQWIPTENVSGKEIYWVLCLFYFILDQQPVLPQQTPIDPSWIINGAPKMTSLSTWIVQYAQQVGAFQDTEASLTPETFETFLLAASFNVSEAAVNFNDPRGGFKTFNDLFSRKLKRGTRPIWQPNDDTQIVFPADSTFDDWFNVDSDDLVTIKNVPWKISDLLTGSQYAGDFTGGVWMHAFLGPSDYHRQHSPIRGKVLESFNIPGLAYLNVIPEPLEGKKGYTITPIRAIGAPDDPGYEFMQLRACIIVENDTVGKVAVLPIGMAQVSSVVRTVNAGDTVEKGDEISCFQFGGSDIVVVFQKEANVTFNATPSRPGPNGEADYYPGEHGQVGHLLATANPPKPK